MINYFYPISKIKNFKIELKSDLEGEVYAIYDYYRVIFFNVIIFILNNTRDSKKEKTLTISVKHHIFTENQGSYYKAIFSFTDESPYIPYNLLNEVLISIKNTELNSISLEKYKLIDFGLLVSFYIANTVYNSEFNVITIPNTNNHMVVTKIFKKPKTPIEEIYYNKILSKLYRENKFNGGLEGITNTNLKNNQEKLKNTVIRKTSTITNNKKMGFNAKEIINKIDKKSQNDVLYDDDSNDNCIFFVVYKNCLYLFTQKIIKIINFYLFLFRPFR